MKASYLSQKLRHIVYLMRAGRLAEMEPAKVLEILTQSADRLDRASNNPQNAYMHAKDRRPNPYDFAQGAKWFAEQIESGDPVDEHAVKVFYANLAK